MSESDPALPRRAVLKSAGLGVGAGLLSGLAAPAQAAGDAEIWSQEYWAKKGDVKLNLWRKRLGAPKPGEAALPDCVSGARLVELVAFLLRSHGARQGRILADERARARRLRRLDHGP